MVELRRELPELPRRMRNLPVDSRGYPVPWFVGYVDGVPDFRVVRPAGREMAITEKRCWLCGEKRGRFGAFVIGPMCSVNRVSSEPPCHLECAEFAVKACPFLVRPHARRRESGYPEEAESADGNMILRNPGVSLIWVSTDWKPFPIDSKGSWLINVGNPDSFSWWREGRPATRAEVQESFDSGCPLLKKEAEREGEEAVDYYEAQLLRALKFLPAAKKATFYYCTPCYDKKVEVGR